MDALLPAFIAVLLAETGGKVQGLSALMGQGQAAARMMAALLLSTLVSLGIALAGAFVIAGMIGVNPRNLLAGLALLFAGVPMLFAPKAPKLPKGKPGFATSLFAFLAAQIGDASQFIIFALAARTATPPLALVGGLAGVMAACALPLVMGKDWPEAVPLTLLRRIAAALLTLAGVWLMVTALGIM
jgi:Ca2+/H+ antiporter, TMEM165/GDT1 family